MGSAFDDDELQAWCDARWAPKVAAREAEAARAARRERAEDLFEERLKRVPTHRMDPRLAELARGSARPRLELGLLLHRMMERRGFIELGLPTFWAYAKERVSQGTRWANDARRLARVLCDEPGLPLVAGALEQGLISWSMAWVVATYLQKFAGTLSVEASLEAELPALSGGVGVEHQGQRRHLDAQGGMTARAELGQRSLQPARVVDRLRVHAQADARGGLLRGGTAAGHPSREQQRTAQDGGRGGGEGARTRQRFQGGNGEARGAAPVARVLTGAPGQYLTATVG